MRKLFLGLLLSLSLTARADTPSPGSVVICNLARTNCVVVNGDGSLNVDATIEGGSLTCNAGTNLNTSALATQATLASILSALGTPFQAGGSIGNTSFAATQAVASALNGTVVTTGGVEIATQATVAAILSALGSPMQQTGGSVSVSNQISGYATQTTLAAVLAALGTPMQQIGGSLTANIGTTNGLALDGTDGTGITPPAGGVGIRGWLSGIYKALSNTLTVAISGTPNVAVTSSVLPTGAATSTNQTNGSQLTGVVAGSAVIGKVGIDQTTPGTTNGVVVNSSALPTGAATQTTLASILSALGSPFQAGGSIGNTSFAATQSTASALNGTMVTTGGAEIATQTTAAAILTALGSPMQNSGGSVSCNAGTNLNTSALALDATLTGGNQKTKIVDGSGNVQGPFPAISGTNYAPVVLAASGASASAAPARTVQVGGSNGTNLYSWFIDALGIGQVSLGNSSKTVVMKQNNLQTTAVTANQVILTYTVTTGKTFYVQYFDCAAFTNAATATASQFGTCGLQIGGALMYQQYMKGSGETNFVGMHDIAEAIPVASATTIQWVTTPASATAANWYANFGGYEK